MRSVALVLALSIFAPGAVHADVPKKPNAVLRFLGMGHPREVKEAIKLAGKMSSTDADASLLGTAQRLTPSLSSHSLLHLMGSMGSSLSQYEAALHYVQIHHASLTADEVLEIAAGLDTFAPEGHAADAARVRRAAKEVSDIETARAIVYDYHPNNDVRAARAQIRQASQALDQQMENERARTDHYHDQLLTNFALWRRGSGVSLSSGELIKLSDGARVPTVKRAFDGLAGGR